MKTLILYSIYLAIFLMVIERIASNNEVELRPEDYDKTWMYFSNGSDLPEVVYLTKPPLQKIAENVIDFIQFELYTQNNINNPFIFPFKFAKRAKRQIFDMFNKNLKTKIIVHGWKSSTSSDLIQGIKDEYLEKGLYNIIAVNWQNWASDIYYLRPAGRTDTVGRAVAGVIDYIVEKLGQNPKLIHLIGHSLGAHVTGFAGSYTKYRISRITGLDPARPAFEGLVGPEGRLDVTDAEFVDVIHSCAGILGFEENIGHVDFYPNGGTAPQPGCGSLIHMFSACSHGRSHKYFAESINSKQGFYSYPCDSWESFQNNNCKTGQSILMGDKVSKSARGVYYLTTNAQTNFAVGKKKK